MCTFRGSLHVNIIINTSHFGHQYLARCSLYLVSLEPILSEVSQLVTVLRTRYCAISLSHRNHFHYLSSGRSAAVPQTTRQADHVRSFTPSHTFKECLACCRRAFTFHSSICFISSSFTSNYFIAMFSYSAGSTCWQDLLYYTPLLPYCGAVKDSQNCGRCG
jgi:hypothetical protein